MHRLAFSVGVALLLSLATPQPARSDTAATLGYTFALTLAGTVAGAALLPYLAPVAAPAVAAAYGTVAGAVDTAATGVGGWLLSDPRLSGAVLGMAAGLVGGIVAFGDSR